MGKSKTAKPDTNPRALELAILSAARDRIGGVLKPYPEGHPKAFIEAALEALEERGLIHNGRDPNLTRAGFEFALTLPRGKSVTKGLAKNAASAGVNRSGDDAGANGEGEGSSDAGPGDEGSAGE